MVCEELAVEGDSSAMESEAGGKREGLAGE